MVRNKSGQFEKEFNDWFFIGETARTIISGNEVICDIDDFEKVRVFKWGLSFSGVCKYATTNMKIKGKYRSVKMHRFLLNPPRNKEIDHKDNNGLNNIRSNLRITDMRFNKRNLTKYKTNTSGYKGVHLVNKHRWQARIQVGGRRIPLGCYGTKEQAALAYNEGAKKYHGEFAHLNVIQLPLH